MLGIQVLAILTIVRQETDTGDTQDHMYQNLTAGHFTLTGGHQIARLIVMPQRAWRQVCQWGRASKFGVVEPLAESARLQVGGGDWLSWHNGLYRRIRARVEIGEIQGYAVVER